MIRLIIIAVLLTIAMLCRSLVHTLLHHYNQFADKFDIINHQWWYPAISWTNKDTMFLQISDAFHFFNTIELGAYTLIITILANHWLKSWKKYQWWMSIVIFLIVGAILIITFNIGYDRLWR